MVFPEQLTVSVLGFIASAGLKIEFFNFYSSTMTSILIKAVSLRFETINYETTVKHNCVYRVTVSRSQQEGQKQALYKTWEEMRQATITHVSWVWDLNFAWLNLTC